MRRIIFHLSTGYAGMDSIANGVFPNDVTDDELDDEAWQRAADHASSYGIYSEQDLQECSQQDLDELTQSGEIDNYTNSIEGCWEDYDPEEHDGLVAGGGEWIWQ